MPLILASASSRRVELLSHLTSNFECHAANIDESQKPQETPMQLAQRLSYQKAVCVRNKFPAAAVLGSDTIVVVDNDALGKPLNFNQSIRMLQRLCNRWHEVITAVSIVYPNKSGETAHVSCCVQTEVQFSAVSDKQIYDYWQTGEPRDKAGSYAIQGIGGQFVTQIKGSYSAVVGLPLAETRRLLVDIGILK